MAHKNVTEALLAFSQEFRGAHKTGVNPHFKSQHFTLDELVHTTNPLLHKHGMVTVHSIGEGEVKTTLIHPASETHTASSIPLPAITDPQKIGSAITYYKRYNLCALLNIAEYDDDGNAASGATDQQLVEIEDYRQSGNVSEAQEIWLTKRGGKLTAQDAEQLLMNIKRKIAEEMKK
jgi:hypothetical protein